MIVNINRNALKGCKMVPIDLSPYLQRHCGEMVLDFPLGSSAWGYPIAS